MEIEIMHYPMNYDRLIYIAGRNCYGLEAIETKTTPYNITQFIHKIIRNNHGSVLEHINISIFIKDVSRSFLAQLTRHRLVSYSVKSQQYTDSKNFKVIDIDFKEEEDQIAFSKLIKDINNAYKQFKNNGENKDTLNYLLPNACVTNIFMTTNIREYRKIIKQRITNGNIPEMREFARRLLIMLYCIMPECFQDLRDKYMEDREDLLYG